MGDVAETLRLEIEVAAKDALKDLTATSSGIKRVSQEAAAAVPPAAELKKTMAALQADLKTSAIAAEFLGDKEGGLRERKSTLKSAIVDLIKNGISPETQELKNLKAQYVDTSDELENYDAKNRSLTDTITQLAQTGAALASAKKLVQFAGESVAAFAEADSAATRLNVALQLRGMTSALPALSSYAEQLQQVTGDDADLVKQLEAELVAQGKSEAEIKKIIQAAAGMSAVSGTLSENVQKLEVSYAGVTGGIGRQIPELKDLTDAQLKSGAAVDIMLAKYSGFIGKTGETSIALVRAKANFGDTAEALGEGLAPEVRLGADLLGSLAEAISKSSEGVKKFAGVVTTIVIGALIGLAARTVIVTASKWGLFGAEMAVNAATAVGNPLLWVGIAAAVAAVAATTALVAAKVKEAKATQDANSEHGASASAMSSAARAAEDYKKALDGMSDAELKAARASLQSQLAGSGGRLGTTTAASQLNAINAELAERSAAAAKEAQKAADEWKKSWAEMYGKAQAEQSSNPTASIDFEEQQKLAEEAAHDTAKTDKKTIDEINAYYEAKRKAAIDSFLSSEAAANAQVTATKVDDLQVEQEAAIAALDARENQAMSLSTNTEAQKLAIASKYASMRAEIEDKYSKQISDTQKKEAADAAAAAFDLENKERAAAVALTASKLDDLELERDRALALFTGTEAQKLILSETYAKKIADAQIEEDKRVFAERLANAKSSGDYGTYAALSSESAISSTQVGQMLGAGGAAAADPTIVLIEAAVKFATSLESVQKILNAFDTALGGASALIDGILGSGADDLVATIVDIGETLGQIAAPFLGIFVLQLKLAAGLLNIFVVPALRLVGAAFSWFYDSVIVPVGNAFINVINGVIYAINSALGWLGVNIGYLSALQTTAQIAAKEQEIADKTSAVSDYMEELKNTFEEKKNELKDAYDQNIGALKNLYELGAISASEYETRASATKEAYNTSLEALESQEKDQLAKLQDILDALNAGNNISAAALHAAGVPGYAIGAVNIPQTQVAVVHKGETIIPESFAAGLRSGDLALSKSGQSGSSMIYQVTVNVAGTVTTEDALVDTLAKKMNRRIKRGQLETA